MPLQSRRPFIPAPSLWPAPDAALARAGGVQFGRVLLSHPAAGELEPPDAGAAARQPPAWLRVMGMDEQLDRTADAVVSPPRPLPLRALPGLSRGRPSQLARRTAGARAAAAAATPPSGRLPLCGAPCACVPAGRRFARLFAAAAAFAISTERLSALESERSGTRSGLSTSDVPRLPPPARALGDGVLAASSTPGGAAYGDLNTAPPATAGAASAVPPPAAELPSRSAPRRQGETAAVGAWYRLFENEQKGSSTACQGRGG
eukprot:354775-Chlamydomonas_euryale.AAC.3